VRVLEKLGFEVRPSLHGYVAFHSELVGSEKFPAGTFSFSDHAGGIQGKVHIKGIKNAAEAVELVEEKSGL